MPMPSKASAAASVALLALVLQGTTGVDAFSSPPLMGAQSRRAASSPLGVASDPAAAMSEYMAKSHEEKLRALAALEAKKNGEIQALLAEVNDLKSGAPALPPVADAAPPAAPAASTAELEKKLASYQDFMTEYIVSSQNAKLLAVKEAELAAEKKFQERLDKMLLPGGSAATELPVAASAEPGGTAFEARNARLVKEGGNSRWGSAEVERALTGVTPASAVASAIPVAVPNPAYVASTGSAADVTWTSMNAEKNSLEARVNLGSTLLASATGSAADVTWTSMNAEKNSLEDRVNLGSTLLASAEAPGGTAFEARNARLVKEGGNSRWGSAEVERASTGVTPASAVASAIPVAVPNPAYVASTGSAADVTWTSMNAEKNSLEARVNLGSTLLASAEEPGGAAFEARNARLVKEGGNSRWGSAEVERALTGVTPAAAVASAIPVAVPNPAYVASTGSAADVTWTSMNAEKNSLEDRINLGSTLLVSAGAAMAGETPASAAYVKRNAQVAAAGVAGKSRWGAAEIKRAMELVETAPVASYEANGAAPAVETAWPSMEQTSLSTRVNVGASLRSEY